MLCECIAAVTAMALSIDATDPYACKFSFSFVLVYLFGMSLFEQQHVTLAKYFVDHLTGENHFF